MADEDKDSMTSIVSQLVKDARSYRDNLSKDRTKATEYSDGKMADVEAKPGRSQVVSRDVRSIIKKVLPSMVRTILGNDKVVEYQPVGPGDEQKAEQATDYVNNIVFPESDGKEAVQDAIHDALQLRNGIIRWWYDTKLVTQVTSHTGLDEQQLIQLVQDDEVTVLEQEQEVVMLDGPEEQVPQTIYNVKIRRRTKKGRTKLAAVPPEEFLIHPDALDIDESPLTGINVRKRRSELVEMGYDREQIDRIPSVGTETGDKDAEQSTRRRHVDDDKTMAEKAMQEVEYYELYVRVDADDDGIAELRRVVYAGEISDDYKLSDEEWDEAPFADIIVERRPHQREGTSVPDDMMEIQRIKTVLLRQTLDNLYWQNMPQPIVREGSVLNPDAVLNPTFGKPIRVSEEVADVRAVLGFTQVPFVAAQSFNMLEYMDREATDRTGVSDASSGMAPDALQNMTAKATSLIEQAGIGQTELMVWTVARGGLKRVFRGLLKLIIKHQDKPRTVRLRDQWVDFDPRDWNAEMDCTVNTGLGAGTRERDMAAMQMILGVQEKFLSSMGAANNPFVTPENIYNATAKMVEAAGLHTPDLYFTKPSLEAIEGMKQSANKPDPAMQKMQMQMQMDQQKATADAQLQQRQMEIDRELRMQEMHQSFELKKYQIDQELQLKRQQNAAQIMTADPISNVHLGGMPG